MPCLLTTKAECWSIQNKNSKCPKENIFRTSWTVHSFVHPSSSQYESPFTPNMNWLKGWERIFGSCALLMRIAVVLAGPCECVCELHVHGLTHLPVICIEEWANWTWVLVLLNCRRQLVHCWKPQWLHCSEGNVLLCASPVAHRPVKTHLGLWQQGARNAIRKRQQKGGLRRKIRRQIGGMRGGDNSDMGWSTRVQFSW